MISREFSETLEWGELEGEGEKRRDGESEDEEEEEEDVLHLTRSGRHYIPKHLVGEESEKTETTTAKEIKKEENLVVDQLKRTPANVNLWQLLMSSKEHRASLLRALAAVEVAEDTTPEQIVGMVKACPGHDMSFEVLPLAMRNHNKPLLITVDILSNEISGAQVDDGSSINVCPVKMLETLGFRRTDLKPSDFVVSGYDNQKRHALGTWRTKIKTGTVEVPIDFTVLDIAAPYPILLGRAWIHSVGAVPSTLHQKMIIPVEGGVETIFGGKSQKASVMLLKSEGDTIAWGNTRQVNMITYEEIEKKMGSGVAHMMKKSSYQPGQGLGVKNQGILEPIDPPTQNGTRGLGYDETLVAESGKTVYGVNRFVKPEAFTGQPEPWDFNGDILPGFEIFLDCPLQKVEPYCGEPEIFVVKGDPAPGFEILFKEKMRMDWEDWTRIQELKEQGARFIELSKTLKERSKLPEGVQDQEEVVESVSSSVGIESPGLRAEEFDESESNNDFVGDVGSLFDNFNELACDSAYIALPTLFDNCINTLNSEHANGPSSVQIDLELTVAVNIGTNDNPREIKIASDLEENEKAELINTIVKYKECFAWSYEDMPGIDPEVAQHYIPTYPEAKPVKQKLRRMRPEWTLQIKEEVDKLLETKFIMPIQYPKWVSNIVVVPKKDGRVRMCVDYRDLNKACPKDDFPLPHIDVLVDQAAGYDRYSCVDGYSGYNQIMMAEEDREKTAFTVEWGTFCYRVMPFGLKNAGATYQRMATTVFHDMMHQTVEVYVDDMVIKSRGSGNHAKALEQFFDRILRFKLRLNPKKCVFGVRTCKLLGFKISQQGIVMDPDKAKAVLEMPEPKTEKEVRAFLGKIQYVSRFISKLTSVCKPIFKLLKKDQPVVWGEECRRAFQQIKECMMNPPVLVPPTPGKPLLLYLAVEEDVVAAMLAQEDDQGNERAIYYLSKKLLSYEERYSMVEKTCLALAWAAKKLHHYLQSYEAHVVSRMDPLKYLFETPPLVSRIARWMALIIQYDLKYITRKSVKGRGVADFLALKSNNEEEAVLEFPDEESRYVTTSRTWKMYFDGSSNKRGAGAGVIITTPEGEQLPIAMKLGFPATNNVVEYEACIHGLVSLLNLGAKEAEVYGDSSVVIFQSNREWVVKDERLREY